MGYDNFGLKIGVEGEREFKNSIKEIKIEFQLAKNAKSTLMQIYHYIIMN